MGCCFGGEDESATYEKIPLMANPKLPPDHPVNVAARNLARKEMEKKKASAAAMKQTWSFGDDEHEMSELKRSPSDPAISPRKGGPVVVEKKKKKKGLLSGTIRKSVEKVEDLTGFVLPTKDDISDSLATVGLAHKDKVKQRQIVESDTFDWV